MSFLVFDSVSGHLRLWKDKLPLPFFSLLFTRYLKHLCACRCDNKNLGLSDLCTFEQDTVSLDPPIWGQNVMDEVRGEDGKKPLPSYIKDNVKSNTRSVNSVH